MNNTIRTRRGIMLQTSRWRKKSCGRWIVRGDRLEQTIRGDL